MSHADKTHSIRQLQEDGWLTLTESGDRSISETGDNSVSLLLEGADLTVAVNREVVGTIRIDGVQPDSSFSIGVIAELQLGTDSGAVSLDDLEVRHATG